MGHHSRDRDVRDGSPERHRGAAANDSRVSRAYRSPPPVSSNRGGEHKSRRDKSPSTPPSSSCLSNFYKERFGSHSPEDYLNLRVSQFDPKHNKDDIRYLLEKEFRHLAPFEIKIVRNPEDNERMAYVNFERPDCAKSVRRALLPRLQKVLGRHIAIDPAGVIRDQEGKFISDRKSGKFVPDRYNRAVLAAADTEQPATYRPIRRSSPIIQRRPIPKRIEMPIFHLNQNDTQAGRTLFVGNLPGDVRESELRRLFESYGTIDDVDIKTLADSNAAYAFLLFETVEGSIAARQGQHNKPIRPGGNRCQLGYGKSQPTQSLIIGGLGSWITSELLEKEFEKYGDIDEIEYDNGSTHAIIRFSESSSATEACTAMKNFELGGEGHHITVDYAREDKKESRLKKRLNDSENQHDQQQQNNKRIRLTTPSPSESPTRVGFFQNLDQLREHVACTWKGVLMLKKSEYPLSLYRVFGKEHLIQEILRDSDGVALRLNINQRLPIISELYQKLIEYDRSQLTMMFALGRDKPCESLIKYLQEKNAAGVVTLEGAILYVFTYSVIAERLLNFFAPRATPLLTPDSDKLLLILKLNQQTQPQTAAPATTYGLANANTAVPATAAVITKKEVSNW